MVFLITTAVFLDRFVAGSLLAVTCWAVWRGTLAIVELGVGRVAGKLRSITLVALFYVGLWATVRFWPQDDGVVVLGFSLSSLMIPLALLVKQRVQRSLSSPLPSKWARLFVRGVVPVKYYDELMGDLLEMHHQVKTEDGVQAANVVLWVHVLRIVGKELLALLVRVADIASRFRSRAK